eukprot:CAMPEP_0184488588 /NCGR_PEP_ID=MMETSP0113_2-20130426/12562_1 /TAXON_ID=91329 /ORGANISM="Norrisiella sphaerica, Strain BC52" /LENGTH=237 /DNA_ID=CAMNT_0026871465 /DNA_START=221 /DNA_END=934 /DNA_ORIENTATION=-
MQPGGVFIPILVAVTMIVSLTWLYLSWVTEPGLVPFIPIEEQKSSETDEAGDGETVLRRNPGKKRFVILLNGQSYPLTKFRAKICRETSACVEKFDHFCPWVGNVVGVRNHRYFVLFTIFTFAVAIEVFASSLFLGVSEVGRRSPKHVPAIALALTAYTSVILLAVGGLMFYHLDLVAHNESTNERLKGVYGIRRNPYNRGKVRNCVEFWCTPIRESYVAADNKNDDVPLPLLPAEP